MADLEVLAIGAPLMDFLVHESRAFLKQVPGAAGGTTMVEASVVDRVIQRTRQRVTRAPGGSEANTAVGLARLGRRAGFFGKAGRDALGRAYQSGLEKAGVRVHLAPSDDPTGRVVGVITPDGERTMLCSLGAAATLAPGDLKPAHFRNLKFVHLSGYLLFNEPVTREVLRLAKIARAKISFDLGAFTVVEAVRPLMEEIIDRHAAIVYANEDEARVFTGTGDESRAVDRLGERCGIAVVKRGDQGSIIKRRRTKVVVEALPATCRDTTGAGDLWAAGFLAAWLSGHSLAVCGHWGSVLGAAAVETDGARLSTATWRRVHRVLGMQPARRSAKTAQRSSPPKKSTRKTRTKSAGTSSPWTKSRGCRRAEFQ